MLRQSNAWPSTIAHPSDNTPVDPQGSCTSSMIPVSHLARDGFTPIAMGMVLCNDADVNPYVHMVQGLHAEGVVSRSASYLYFSLTIYRHFTFQIPPVSHSSFFPQNSMRQTPCNDLALRSCRDLLYKHLYLIQAARRARPSGNGGGNLHPRNRYPAVGSIRRRVWRVRKALSSRRRSSSNEGERGWDNHRALLDIHGK